MATCKELSVGDMLKQVTSGLKSGSVTTPRLEAEMIVSEIAGLSHTQLFTQSNRKMHPTEIDAIKKAVRERLTGCPIQYVLGRRRFRYLDLICREDVLIPRSETELLVDAAIEELAALHVDYALLEDIENISCDYAINKPKTLSHDITVVDLGCGTGAIGLSIAYECAGAFVYMTDKSPQAVSLTRENTKRNGLQERVSIIESDMFSTIGHLKNTVNIMVSNPPYVGRSELAGLQREVRFEPRMALDGGIDGLDYYRMIVEHAPEFLKDKGVLLLEVGDGQSRRVMDLLNETGLFTDIDSSNDYQGIERIVKAQKA